ncbi:MAG: TatD-related deoxyribonuclease [Verrucomicrobia bacterium]|nr:TatD-related deoxyribonuclease [Verrucomicrobiota bacterium]
MNLYDAHNHLHDEWLAPHRRQIFADMETAQVKRAVVNGTSEADWPEVAQLAREHAIVLPSYGLHPWDVGNRTPAWQENFLGQLDADPRAIVGEIGLDRWILDRARPDDPRLQGLRRAPTAEQLEVFRWQLAVAAERNLPASIHCLDAFGLMLETLQDAQLPSRGFLLHAYSGPVEMIPGFAQLGAYFSFNGGFLEPRKERLREVFAAVPLDRLLAETDAPAMRLPANLEKFPPFATETAALANHPANLGVTYAGLAELRGTDLKTLANRLEENFLRLFKDGP